MIDIKKLIEKDIGRWVKYTGSAGEENFGRIKTWNDIFVFVVYNCDNVWDRFKDFTPSPTNPNCLEFIDEKKIIITGELPYFEIDKTTKQNKGFLRIEVEEEIKILKIKHCEECKHNDYFYDTKTNLGRFICRHPEFKTKYRTYKIINRLIALKGKIPYWCPLEDYKDEK